MNRHETFLKLKDKISSHKAVIAVIGLGYVGLPLALEFVKVGFKVIGVDTDSLKIASLKKSTTYITDISDEELVTVNKTKRFFPTTDYKQLAKANVIIICVPTPLRKTKEPDISYIITAAKQIQKTMSKGKLVVLESTTYPGTTQEVLLPILLSGDHKHKDDFYVVFSPERVDPGNPLYKTANIPKVVGGICKDSTQLGKILYSQIVDTVIGVSSSSAAEMVKMYENTFRSVNIALANELSLLCQKLGVDVWEVIDAAASKPFGFMPFYPGPGIGGHCIPLDPLYLSWKAKLHDFEPRFIDLASQVNSSMPKYVVARLTDLLNEKGKSLKGSNILVIGVAYKKDVSDTRESPAVEIISLLKDKGAKACFHDPYVAKIKIDDKLWYNRKLSKKIIAGADCVLIITNHLNIDYHLILQHAKLVFDTRNALKEHHVTGRKVVRL